MVGALASLGREPTPGQFVFFFRRCSGEESSAPTGHDVGDGDRSVVAGAA
jgi:hypothetical protein